ncbi:MAG: nucleotidyltransferase family protein [Clostridiales Family XIII bacterium]|jgi:predicted nucleotidyltransferase|nr:nucleotidyltransferase family protein [Clostridiales Family XIII bacterium]
MSKTVGVIAEYNPFHKGHLYCLNEAKRLAGADRAVCVMSGPFVQRGEPALIGKYHRAEMAVRNGMDLVLELPFVYAATGAANFAHGGIRMLLGLGCADAIAFGSESGSPSGLRRVAGALAGESAAFSREMANRMKAGVSYPAARRSAVAETLGEDAAALLDHPNDILAVEYLKQISLLSSADAVDVVPVPRIGSTLSSSSSSSLFTSAVSAGFAGAGAIRELLRRGRFEEALSYLPPAAAAVLKPLLPEISGLGESGLGDGDILLPAALFTPAIHSLLSMDGGEAAELYAAGEGLENRLLRAAASAEDYEELIAKTKSKRYTETRIRRLILHAAMRLTKADVNAALTEPIPARVLAFGPAGAQLLREIKRKKRDIIDTIVYDHLSRSRDDLAAARRTVGLGVRADKLYRTLAYGSLAGFRYNPEPVRTFS